MYFLPIIALLVCTAFAADVSFEGTLDADYANYLEKDFTVNNSANHDLRLKMNADLDENVRAVVGVASYTPSGIRNREDASPISSEDRWSGFQFDGISVEWTVRRDLTFIFGDLTYSFGGFNYYMWRNPDNYAAVLTTQGMRGLGVKFAQDGYIYIGASDANDKSGRIAASYAIAIPGLNKTNNKFTVAPMLDFNKGGGRDHNYTVGGDLTYSRSYTDLNYMLRGVFGLHPSKNDDLVTTFMMEPSFNYKSFSLAGTLYWALLSNDEDGSETITINETYSTDEKLIYVEPSYSFNKKFSLGLSNEWHKTGDDRPDWYQIAPVGYLYPTAGVDLAYWLGYAIVPDGKSNPAFGISSSVVF